jgi:hypothetical protein
MCLRVSKIQQIRQTNPIFQVFDFSTTLPAVEDFGQAFDTDQHGFFSLKVPHLVNLKSFLENPGMNPLAFFRAKEVGL